MEKLISVYKHYQDNNNVLYYFTDYMEPTTHIITPLKECIEGFIEIDLSSNEVKLKECSDMLTKSSKYRIVDEVILSIKKHSDKNEFPDYIYVKNR